MSDLGNKEIMAVNLKHYMAKKDVKASDICKELGFAPATFSDWLHARTYPRIDKIEMMANYFGISKADLVEKDGPVKRAAYETVLYRKMPPFEPVHTEVLTLFSKLNPEHKQTVLDLLRFYAQSDQTSD